MRHLFLTVVENSGSILSWWHSKWPNSTPLHHPPKKEKKEKAEKQDKEKPEKDKEISPSVLPRKIPTRKQSKFLSD